jgi:hypothetical protein
MRLWVRENAEICNLQRLEFARKMCADMKVIRPQILSDFQSFYTPNKNILIIFSFFP